LKHEENSLGPTKNFEPACNTSSDDDSEDEEDSRDGDNSWTTDFAQDMCRDESIRIRNKPSVQVYP